MAAIAPIERNGWKLIAHRAFLERYLDLLDEVEKLKRTGPEDFKDHPKTKLLARIQALIFDEIPKNPNAPEYLQGNTLGKTRRHWKRAKFLSRFRLFFRFSTVHKVIIYVWVNDENTLRKDGARSDPYALFAQCLISGNPPDSWDKLMEVAEGLPVSATRGDREDRNTVVGHRCRG